MICHYTKLKYLVVSFFSPASYPIGTGGSFSGGKVAGALS